MATLLNLLQKLSGWAVYPLDNTIPLNRYTPIDLSTDNPAFGEMDGGFPLASVYVDHVLTARSALVAYGGYLEKRDIYRNNPHFTEEGESPRDIHLGMDLWTRAGTRVVTPLDGRIHSYRDNSGIGNYGPTIIVEHNIQGQRLYTLYGHLSRESLLSLKAGSFLSRGSELGYLGDTSVNGNYAPHLHFQLICDLGVYHGDYPGVCAEIDLEFYASNCPDPSCFLKFH